MGHSSKFIFPLPGRRAKNAPHPPIPNPPGPFTTKAQKILGATELAIGLPAWETRSNSGISIAVSDSTNGDHGHGTARDRRGVPNTPQMTRERRWEQDSEVIPATLNKIGSMAPEGATDASSLRRRQSSSTITSYYDKSNLPLAISQQTSNSAMAKGLPAKAQALLDIDGELSHVNKARKKPSRLDLSALLRGRKSPKQPHADPNKGKLLGSDAATKSPSFRSVVSASPSPTPPPTGQRGDWGGLRRKVTRESLRESPAGRPGTGNEQPTKASVDLCHLYDHYEQRTFGDAMDPEYARGEYHLEPPSDRQPPSYPVPVPSQSGKAFLSPFPPNSSRSGHLPKQPPPRLTAAELRRAGAGTPSSPVPADCASISSRHTRTSKASRRTDHSLQEIDLLQNSVLALSSDSEDDYEFSSKGSLTVPPLSDGQASPTSPRSPMSQTSTGAYDGGQAGGKPVKRTTFAPTTPQAPPASQGPPTMKAPKISARSSSLNSKPKAQPGHILAHETSRLSIGTTSTDRTVSRAPDQSQGAGLGPLANKAPKKVRSESHFDFPAPPTNRASRSASVSRVMDQSRAVVPPSVDLYLQSQRSPAGPDNASIRSGASVNSAANGRRSSAASVASSIHDGNSGRFMAVTRQEEMLLAALRMKRARMREDIIAEFEGDPDRDEGHPLKREMTNDSAGSMSRQSSRSTMRQEAGTLSARPRQKSLVKPAEKKEKAADTLTIVVDRASYDGLRSPGSEMSDFIHFDDSVTLAGPGGLERHDSKASSASSQKSASARHRASLGTLTAPVPRRSPRRDGSTPRRTPETTPMGQNDLPHRILEDPAEDDDHGVPRPDSPISPSDFPTPLSMSMTNKKQVRLSAVGFYKPSDAGW